MGIYFSIMIPIYFTVCSFYWTLVKADKGTSKKIKIIKGLRLLNSVSIFGCFIFCGIQIMMKAYWIDKPGLLLYITALQVIVCSLLLRFWEHNVKNARERKT